MKYVFTLLLTCLVSCFTYSQSFTYFKVLQSGHSLKMKGSIVVNDSVLTITGKDFKSDFKLEPQTITDEVKIYKSVLTNESEMRVTLHTNNEPKLMLEVKDSFSGNFISTIYYLKRDEKE